MWEQIQESEDQGSDKKLWDWLFWEDMIPKHWEKRQAS